MPQFPALCPVTRAVAAPWLLNEHTLLEAPGVEGLLLDSSAGHAVQLHTVYSTWYFLGRRGSCWTLPQGTLYSYIQYMALENLYFQSNFSEDGCNQPTNQQTNKSNQRQSLPPLSKVITASFPGWVTCGAFSRDSAFPLPQPWAFHTRLLDEGDLRVVPAWGHTVLLQSAPPSFLFFLEWSSKRFHCEMELDIIIWYHI